jgi:transaldolase
MMEFFADTANSHEIDYCFSKGVCDGITTNPMIMKNSGDLSKGFEEACRELVNKYPSVPISLETDLRGIDVNDLGSRVSEIKKTLLEQSYSLAALGNNVVIKIPISEGGLEAAIELEERGIRTNVTACITPYQALGAVEAGASYVSLFANRILDTKILELAGYTPEVILLDPNWKEIVKQNQHLKDSAWDIVLGQISYVASTLEGSKSKLIVGSIRSPKDVEMLAEAQPQIITIPFGIVKGIVNPLEIKKSTRKVKPNAFEFETTLAHPMTTYTLEEFERSADIYRVK